MAAKYQYIMSIHVVLCSSRNFIASFYWKLNQKTLYTLCLINSFRENTYRKCSGSENNRKNKESCICERLKTIVLKSASPTLYSKRVLINHILYVLRILSKDSFWLYFCLCWNAWLFCFILITLVCYVLLSDPPFWKFKTEIWRMRTKHQTSPVKADFHSLKSERADGKITPVTSCACAFVPIWAEIGG